MQINITADQAAWLSIFAAAAGYATPAQLIEQVIACITSDDDAMSDMAISIAQLLIDEITRQHIDILDTMDK